MHRRFMITFLRVGVILLILSILGGCSRMFGVEDKNADQKMKQIIEVIYKQDKDSLKAMFSDRALSESEDIDEKINSLFDFYQGEVKDFERKGYSFYDSVENRKVIKKECYSWYRINTKMYNYFFIMIDYPVDILQNNNKGIYTLRVIKSDKDSIEFSWEEIEEAGIYMVEE